MYLPTPSGRQRLNVLGAIDAITHQLFTIINEKYIDSNCVVDLMKKIAIQNFGVPITLILDNAKYQRCELVKKWAEYYSIELLFLPSYSPNLNLIERLWKWIKNDCLYCKYYSNFALFKEAIFESIAKTQQKEHKQEMDSLLTLKFQSFKNTQIITY